MDSALLHTPDGRYICSAQELCEWDPDIVAAAATARRFTCTGCLAHQFPKAYVRPARRQPHFSLYGGGGHTPDCLLELSKAALKRADRDADTADPTTVLHPVKLADTPAESVTATGSLEDLVVAGKGLSTRSSGIGSDPDSAPRPIRSRLIRAFADAHLDMNRAQRVQAEIDLPGIDARYYQFAFRRLPQWNVEGLSWPRRVFYAQLRWTADIEDTGSEYRIMLHAGSGYDKSSKRFDRPWTLVAHHDGWTSKGRRLFLDEFETAISQARNEALEPWCFALGEQSQDSAAEIHVSIRQHIAFMPVNKDRAPA